jgi:hypothetical protein
LSANYCDYISHVFFEPRTDLKTYQSLIISSYSCMYFLPAASQELSTNIPLR